MSKLSYYTSFQVSSIKIPSYLHQVLERVWQCRYEELYEEAPTFSTTLEETLSEVLEAFKDFNDYSLHSRYICMALILALAVEPTVKAYLPNDTRPKQVFETVNHWVETHQKPTETEISTLFPSFGIGTQAIDEALDVFKNVLVCLDFKCAFNALLEILDDCFEGYAIQPGSTGRRELFNWWLLDVVPAAWCLQIPETIYTIVGIQSLETQKDKSFKRFLENLK